MDTAVADKKCLQSELIRYKIIFAYKQKEKEKAITNLSKKMIDKNANAPLKRT